MKQNESTFPPRASRTETGASCRATFSGLAFAIPVVLVWGATFVNTKALLADFSALEILALRFALAWCALWAIHPRGMGPLRARDEALFAAAGLAGALLVIAGVAAASGRKR